MVTLLTSELVTNAVLHAGTDLVVELCLRNGIVRVEVQDHSAKLPKTLHYGANEQTGRGLALVERAALAWGVQPQSTGKTVWFEVAV